MDRRAGRRRRLRALKDLVADGGSTGFAAMDRILREGAGKYHYSNHPTYHTDDIPSVVEHWNNQSEIAPYILSSARAASTTPPADIPAMK